jgi:hypothetical protein
MEKKVPVLGVGKHCESVKIQKFQMKKNKFPRLFWKKFFLQKLVVICIDLDQVFKVGSGQKYISTAFLMSCRRKIKSSLCTGR